MVMSSGRVNANMIDAMNSVKINKVVDAVNGNMDMRQILEICNQMDAAMDTGDVLEDADYEKIMREVGMQMND